MIKIAKFEDTYLYAPKKSYYSFFNSPYIGHRSATAVDVYSSTPMLPIEEGKVKEIRKVNPPRHIDADLDYLIIIQFYDLCLKVLHVRPDVKIGEKLYLGDSLGQHIRSGFFRKWSDNHAHYELRKCNDAYRARGAYPLKPIIIKDIPVSLNNEFIVMEKKEEYLWLKSIKKSRKGMTPLGGSSYWIEGGIPHYGYGAIFGKFEKLSFWGLELSPQKIYEDIALFSTNFKIKANGKEVKGIGVYCRNPRIKLIGGNFDVGERIRLKIEPLPFQNAK